MNTLAKLGIDIVNGAVDARFASENGETNNEVLYNGLIEVNGGTEFNYKVMRNGAGNGLFEIIETIIANTVIDGLAEDDFFNRFVEYRNLAAGDENKFYVPDNSLLLISDMAEGHLSIRRQRIDKGITHSVTISNHGVKTYEETRRLLARRVSLIDYTEKVGKSMLQAKLELAYATFLGGLTKLPATFQESGVYDEDKMLALIDHVEASTGKTAFIVGTRTALRKIDVDTTANGDEAKRDKYAMGYYGTVAGTDVMVIKQKHTVDTFDFAFSEDDLWIVVGDEKPVKFVTEGEVIMEIGKLMDNKDMTIDVIMTECYGADIVLGAPYAQYQM